MKKLTRILVLFLSVIITIGIAETDVVSAYAIDDPVNYTFGNVYQGSTEQDGYNGYAKYFNITLDKSQHIFIEVNSQVSFRVEVYNEAGDIVSNNSNSITTRNDAKTNYNIKHSVDLNAGKYQIRVFGPNVNYKKEFSFIATAEDIITVQTPAISSMTSTTCGKMTIEGTSADGALVYEFQYSKNSDMSNATTLSTSELVKTIENLNSGSSYYARVRAYYTYSDGQKVYSNWSGTKSVFIKHNLDQYTIGEEPTYTYGGTLESFRCRVCGKCFSDNNGVDEISVDDIHLDPIGLTKGQILDAWCVNESGDDYYLGKVKVISPKNLTVALTKAKNTKNVVIGSVVVIGGNSESGEDICKLTQINANAFKGKKIRTVTIGKNVKTIKSNAFKGSKATKLIVKTKLLKKAKVKGFLKGSKINTIQVKIGTKKQNRTYVKKYKKFFTKANAGKKVVVK